MVVCTTGLATSLKDELKFKVTASGGQFVNDLTHRVTHLVATKACQSAKYSAAVKHGIPIVTVEWVKSCCRARKVLSLSQSEFGLKLALRGCSIAVSGFPMRQREFLGKLIVSCGGIYSRHLCKDETTHLIVAADAPTSSKITAALEWGIPVLQEDWLHECSREGNMLPIEQFRSRVCSVTSRGTAAGRKQGSLERKETVVEREREECGGEDGCTERSLQGTLQGECRMSRKVGKYAKHEKVGRDVTDEMSSLSGQPDRDFGHGKGQEGYTADKRLRPRKGVPGDDIGGDDMGLEQKDEAEITASTRLEPRWSVKEKVGEKRNEAGFRRDRPTRREKTRRQKVEERIKRRNEMGIEDIMGGAQQQSQDGREEARNERKTAERLFQWERERKEYIQNEHAEVQHAIKLLRKGHPTVGAPKTSVSSVSNTRPGYFFAGLRFVLVGFPAAVDTNLQARRKTGESVLETLLRVGTDSNLVSAHMWTRELAMGLVQYGAGVSLDFFDAFEHCNNGVRIGDAHKDSAGCIDFGFSRTVSWNGDAGRFVRRPRSLTGGMGNEIRVPDQSRTASSSRVPVVNNQKSRHTALLDAAYGGNQAQLASNPGSGNEGISNHMRVYAVICGPLCDAAFYLRNDSSDWEGDASCTPSLRPSSMTSLTSCGEHDRRTESLSVDSTRRTRANGRVSVGSSSNNNIPSSNFHLAAIHRSEAEAVSDELRRELIRMSRCRPRPSFLRPSWLLESCTARCVQEPLQKFQWRRKRKAPSLEATRAGRRSNLERTMATQEKRDSGSVAKSIVFGGDNAERRERGKKRRSAFSRVGPHARPRRADTCDARGARMDIGGGLSYAAKQQLRKGPLKHRKGIQDMNNRKGTLKQKREKQGFSVLRGVAVSRGRKNVAISRGEKDLALTMAELRAETIGCREDAFNSRKEESCRSFHGLQDCVVCVSGYSGAERLCVRKLAVEMGARFSDVLSGSTTHLVCKGPNGAKFEKVQKNLFISR